MNEFKADAIYEEERERLAGITDWANQPTGSVCLNCKSPTGFGQGTEPKRYDLNWCSSKCWAQFYKGLES